MTKHYVEVAPAIPLPFTQRQLYTYHLDQKPTIHSIVEIPFGKRKRIKGVIMAVTDKKVSYPTKAASLTPFPALTDQQIAFATWISRTMQGGLGYTLRLFMPSGKGQINTQLSQPQTLLLTPEIWMAEQLFEEKKGPGVATAHSDMSAKQYRELWYRVASNEVTLVIGTQKALFLPFRNLKKIILHEESIASHTLWDQYPRLSNWYGARELTKISSAEIEYTSTLPSVRLWHQQKSTPLTPRFSIMPIAFSKKTLRPTLPPEIISEAHSWAKNKQKVAILYNRRGLILPRSGIFTRVTADKMPVYSEGILVGTSALFPYLAETKFDQIIWLFPERNLFIPDFRSRERAMITLARLSSSLPADKKVIIATRKPQLIQDRLGTSLPKYYEEELKERKRLFLPPYADMLRLTVGSFEHAVSIRRQIEAKHINNQEKIIIRGPWRSEQGSQLLLLGRLPYLKKLYTGLPIQSVDLDPVSIL